MFTIPSSTFPGFNLNHPVQIPSQNFTVPQVQFQPLQPPKRPCLVYVMLGDETESVYMSQLNHMIELVSAHNDPFKVLMKDHSKHTISSNLEVMKKKLGDRVNSSVSYPATYKLQSNHDVLSDAIMTRFFIENMYFQGETVQLVVITSNYNIATVSYVYNQLFKDCANVSVNHTSCKHTEEETSARELRLNQSIDYMFRLLLAIKQTNGCIYSLWNLQNPTIFFDVNKNDNKTSDYVLKLRN